MYNSVGSERRSRVDVSGDAIFGWKNIKPEVAGTDHLHNEHARQPFKRECVANATASLLQGADAALGHRDMFLTGAFVEGDTKIGEFATQGLKLAVGFKDFEQEPTLNVDIPNFFDICHDGVRFCIFEPGHGTKLDGTAHGHKKWHLVDFHDVNTEDDSSVLCHDCDGYRYEATSPYLVRCCSDSLAFQGPKVGSKDVFSIVNVL